ncbi:hypothetical protein [Microbulbifer sp. ALW1]|uniref:hypothetical protein n=1 Tax=Microbulbifer sp. (strain ALW1) TaxID=1516059 RepID=UPI00135B3010|nr:hypothetical protein [Microbulbifer sp. ALW1]
MANICADKPTFVADLNVNDTFDLTLKPVSPVNGEAQYWPLFNAANPGEEFGNILFQFRGQNKSITLNITLDTSEVEGIQFTKTNQGNFDGIVGLSPEFKQEFNTKASKGSDKNYSVLQVTAKIKSSEQAADGNDFSFLWLCQDINTEMNIVSGDPKAALDPL